MPRTAFHLLWGLPVAAMLMGLAAALWPAAEPAATANAAGPAPVGAATWPATSKPLVTLAGAPAAAPAAEDPMQGLSAEERAALAAALAGHPARDAEMRRVAGFLRLQRQVQAWREARAKQPDAAAAARIEAALPAALAARSVSAGEALQLQAQLIAAREPDAARADAELAAWRARHVVASAGPTAREREFLAQQQALVAAYQGKPEKLEPALQALRLKHFSGTN